MEKEAVSEATIFQRAAHNTATARLFLLLQGPPTRNGFFDLDILDA